VVGDLLLGFLGKVWMIPQVLEVLGKLTFPVRNIRSVEKVVVADIFDGLRQQSLLCLQTKIDRVTALTSSLYAIGVRKYKRIETVPNQQNKGATDQ
jgi:hypothetical protein